MLEVRRVAADDWQMLREIRLAALKDAPEWFWAIYDDELEKAETWWRWFIDVGAWFVALEKDQAVGIAAAISDRSLADSDRQLISMWVVPRARGRGIGTRLVERVKDWARAEGVRQLQLDVTEGNDGARRLYERCGFRPTGRTTPHPRNPRLLEREMRLRLQAAAE